LSRRYAASRNAAAIAELLAAAMNETGAAADETTIGARVASAIHGWALTDGACEDTKYACRDKVYTTKNPDLMNPLWSGAGALRDPSRWQRLKMGVFTDKSDVTINGYPDFTTPQWGRVRPFAIVRPAGADAYFDPPPPPMWGPDGTSASHAQFVGNHTVVAKCSSWNDPDDGAEWSISPGDHALGANSRFGETIGCDANLSSACANVGVNHQFNPATQKPYAPNRAKRGDYLRVMSEYWERMFWRAGPESDSPTRLWNWLLDRVVLDDAAFDFRWAGASADAPLDRQEFELRSYLLLNAGLHDAAIAVWEVKLKYDSARPVSALRFMASLGQSSNTSADNYHAGALPIIEDLMRIVTPADVCEARCGNYSMAERGFLPGPFFYVGINNIGKMMVRAWRAQTNTGVYGVGWFLGQDWNTFRRPTFVTPPFPGFVSGHSTFARVAADTLVRITGSAFFPGGLYSFTFPPTPSSCPMAASTTTSSCSGPRTRTPQTNARCRASTAARTFRPTTFRAVGWAGAWRRRRGPSSTAPRRLASPKARRVASQCASSWPAPTCSPRRSTWLRHCRSTCTAHCRRRRSRSRRRCRFTRFRSLAGRTASRH
jgi:hypothetical protein